MNRFDTAMKQLRDRLTGTVGETTIYRREGQSATLITYSGKTAFRFADMGMVRVEWSDRDFFIPAEQLKLNDVQIYPQKGDVIEVAFVGEGLLSFEVTSPNDEQVWRFSDTCRSIMRIHTKRINP